MKTTKVDTALALIACCATKMHACETGGALIRVCLDFTVLAVNKGMQKYVSIF